MALLLIIYLFIVIMVPVSDSKAFISLTKSTKNLTVFVLLETWNVVYCEEKKNKKQKKNGKFCIVFLIFKQKGHTAGVNLFASN